MRGYGWCANTAWWALSALGCVRRCGDEWGSLGPQVRGRVLDGQEARGGRLLLPGVWSVWRPLGSTSFYAIL
jgi:hypothetical protein